MRVSIIIPFYNRSHTIERCLKSVTQQTLTDFECLVIDDGSHHSESEFLLSLVKSLEDDRFQVILMDTNQGGGAARNQGIDKAQGKYIAFLDSDDEWLPQKLELQLEYSITECKAFVSCQSFVHHAGGIGLLPQIQLEKQRVSDYLFVRGGWIQTSSLLIERKALDNSRFDESLPRHQDYDLLFQLEYRGIQPTILMEPLVRVHWEDLDSSGRAVNIENSTTFGLSRKKHFSSVSFSCFMAKFVLIPTIRSKGRIAAMPLFFKWSIKTIANKNLALEILSYLIFKNARLLTLAAKMKNAIK